MKFIPDYSDKRLKDNCIFCHKFLTKNSASKDHVPSKVFLDKPYPQNLFVIWTCEECNNSFSKDEEYAAAILGVMMSGTADPDEQVWDKAKQILARQTTLQRQL